MLPGMRDGFMQNALSAERAKYILAVVLYGTIGMFLRYVKLPSEIVVLARGSIGSLFILLYQAARGQKMNREGIRKNLPLLVVSGICLGLNWIFLFAAYIHTTVAIASLCNYMAPIIVILIAPVVLQETLNRKKLLCVAVAFLGIILVSGFWAGEIGDKGGVIMGLIAAVCFVIIVICNRKMRGIPAMDRATVQLALSALTVLPYVLVKNRGAALEWDARSVIIIFMLGVLHTGVAYCLYFSGMGSLPVQTVAILGYLEPVVSVFCSVLFLHEHMGLFGWVGAVLILGAAVISETIKE